MRTIKLVLLLIHLCGVMYAQKQVVTVDRVEPPFWWTDMADQRLQLLVKGQNISTADVSITYPGVEVTGVHKAEDSDYAFIDLQIGSGAVPGTLDIEFTYGKKGRLIQHYELKARQHDPQAHKGLGQGDVIYLLTPDRFANGNPSNDTVKGMKEGVNRSFDGGRHGGDLQGIRSRLDYIEDLGMTTLWLNPVLENDMPEYSYHGYAITDYYKVDPRYGTNEEYRQLAAELHQRGMKLIMDMVFNHCGLDHWWMQDMPFGDWVHDYPQYEITNYAIAALSDPHGSESDRRQMEKGWFVPSMPDLNHDNPHMATYLIQNTIWWVEYAGLDGIRVDTYPYNNKEFMAAWSKRVHREYPDLYLVGETWIGSVAQVAYWTDRGPEYNGDYNSHTDAMTDFPLCFAIHQAFKAEGDVMALYDALSKDFLYYDASRNKVFGDNHDIDRIYHTLGKDLDRFNQAMTFLLTTRGVPQVYYGTEIIMKGSGPHGLIREDFPGGWSADSRNAFTADGRTTDENVAFDHIRKLLTWRKQSDAIANGALRHFIPRENLYVYNRKSDKESVLVMINNSASAVKPDMQRFSEVLKGYEGAVDILSGKNLDDLYDLRIEGNRSLILELKPQVKAE